MAKTEKPEDLTKVRDLVLDRLSTEHTSQYSLQIRYDQCKFTLSNFNHCCGSVLFHGFSFPYDKGDKIFEKVSSYLKRGIDANHADDYGVGSVIAIDNGNYQELYEASDEWKSIHSFTNPNSRNKLTYWEIS